MEPQADTQGPLLSILDLLGWLTDEECGAGRSFLQAMERLFRRHDVAVTPLVALRVEDVLVAVLVTRRIEAAFAQNESLLGPGKSGGEGSQSVIPAVDAAGKARERK